MQLPRREPHLDGAHAAEAPPLRRPLLSLLERRRVRWTAVILLLSLLLHAGLLVLAGMAGSGRRYGVPANAIPVQLVMKPPEEEPKPPEPPKPKPEPQQKQSQQQPPPPHGPLASDELGNPNATGKEPVPSDAPAAGAPRDKPGEAPPPAAAAPESKQPDEASRPKETDRADRSAMPDQDQPPPTPEQVAAAGMLAPPPPAPEPPRDQTAARKVPKPSPVRLIPPQPGGARRPTERPDELDEGEGHKAKYPGPDASYDEYLHYIRDLTLERLALLPPGLFQGRGGLLVFDVRIRDSGAIVWFSRIRSSGYPDADRAVQMALDGIGSFPPLPNEVRDPTGEPAQLKLTLPLAQLERNASNR